MYTSSGFLPRLSLECNRERGARRRRLRSARRPRARVPWVESLEERRVRSGYTVINMGSLGGTKSIDLDINSHGSVVGGSDTANNGTEHAYLFSHGKMTDLGTLGTGTMSQADGINDSAEVVGASTTAPGATETDLFLDRHGHMTDLGPINPNEQDGDIKINARGDVIGFFLTNGDAALDRKGKLIDLGSLAGLGSAARALNDSDEVVGASPVSGSGSNEVIHAFLYKHGKMTDLGTLGGADSLANDINDQGEIVGAAVTGSGAEHAFLYRKGHMIDLGALAGGLSDAGAINNRGEVVGESLVSATVLHGFLYEHGEMTDLNSLIPANSGFVITSAEDINDRGQIAALAVSTNPQDQTQYVVLLDPTK